MKENVRNSLREVINSMSFQMRTLLRIMNENFNDPYFETEEGKDMMRRIVTMTVSHLISMITLNDNEEKLKNVDIEELLKKAVEKSE